MVDICVRVNDKEICGSNLSISIYSIQFGFISFRVTFNKLNENKLKYRV